MDMKYYVDYTDNQIYAYAADGSQDDYIKSGLVQITKEQADQIIENNTPKPTADDNKSYAISLLLATDWVNQPDVRDPNNSPHLLNADEFDAYRLEVRKIAVNPVGGDIVFPTMPIEKWSD